nr:MFS transporter [Geomicrobium halophilum]
MSYGLICYFMVGSMHVLFGSLLPLLIEEGGISPSMGGVLIFFQFAGFLIGIVISPFIIQKSNRLLTIFTFQGLLFMSIFGITLSLDLWSILCMGFLVGVSSGSLESTTGSLTLDQDNGDRAISILEVAFGIGALSFPLLINYSNYLSLDWRYILYGLCVLVLFNMVFYLKYHSQLKLFDKNVERYSEKTNKKTLNWQGNIGVIALFSVFAFFYAGLETNFANYLPLLIQELLPETSVYLYSISAFWLGMIIGRLIIGSLVNKIPNYVFIVFATFISLITLGTITVIQNGGFLLINVFLIGFILAGIFPISLFNFTEQLKGEGASLTASTLFIGSASLGGSIFSLVIGPTIEFGGGTITMYLFMGVCIVLIILSIFILKRWRMRYTTSNHSSIS